MKTKNPGIFFRNLIIYTAISFALYYLYSPWNNHPNNSTRSSAAFVYQQF
ncbi:MAG TPA: hypothetical protein VF868_14970 [Bacteroidia bacterium]